MARITPIDVIKGISGKYGSGSNDYFATNTSSNRIRLAKYLNPYQGPATEKQLAQQARFAARQAAVTSWFNANKPSADNGDKGTEAYQYVQKLKRQYTMSNITQVLYKYLDEDNVIQLPPAAGSSNPGNTGGAGNNNGGAGNDSGGGSDTGGSGSGDNTGGSGGDSGME